MGGHDPYSASKGCAELVTAAYRRSFFAAGKGAGHPAGIATARAGNVIGGGDWSRDRLVPDAVRAFARGERVLLRNPEARRPWQHVLDPLAGYLLLAQRLASDPLRFGGGWNFGPKTEEASTVSAVVEELARRWGGNVGWSGDTGSHPHEAHELRLDCQKATTSLGWRPRLELGDAIERVASWFRAFHAGEDARRLTLGDIERYEALG
jgi:CDP-glucose 4,6-dehydratase